MLFKLILSFYLHHRLSFLLGYLAYSYDKFLYRRIYDIDYLSIESFLVWNGSVGRNFFSSDKLSFKNSSENGKRALVVFQTAPHFASRCEIVGGVSDSDFCRNFRLFSSNFCRIQRAIHESFLGYNIIDTLQSKADRK